MNIPPHTVYYTNPISRNLIIKKSNNGLFELLKLPINSLINAATDNTPLPKLLLNKIDFLRQNLVGNAQKNSPVISINNKYNNALHIRLSILSSLLSLEDSSRCLLIFHDKNAIFNAANAILYNKKSSLIHYISSLTSIAQFNKTFHKEQNFVDLEKSLVKKIFFALDARENLDENELITAFSLFSIFSASDKPAGNLLLGSLKTTSDTHPLDIIEKLSFLLISKNLSIESQSLLLESIGHIHPEQLNNLPNTNSLLQKLLLISKIDLLESSDSLAIAQIGTDVISKICYAVFKTGHTDSPLYSQLVDSLTEDNISRIKFKSPTELFRTSFALIIGSNIFKTHISKWILRETVRLSQEALRYPSQFLFLLTGLSLCPDLKISDTEKTLGSSICFDKSIYEKAEAELRQMETGELQFSSDHLSIRHLFSLAESLITNVNNEEFAHILHTFCSTKLRHPRLVKMKLYSESIKRLPNLPLEALPQLLRAFSWLLGIKSEESRRLGNAVTDRLIGELIKEHIYSVILIECLAQLDRYSLFSTELGALSCINFSKSNYKELGDLPFSTSINLLHYLSNSLTSPSVTTKEPNESEVNAVRDILFSKCLYIIRNISKGENISEPIRVEDITNLLHSAHVRGEVTRLSEMLDLCITVVNMNLLSGMSGDSLSALSKLLTVMSGKEYKFNLKGPIFIVPPS